MSKLIYAHLFRLRRDEAFWIECALMAAVGVLLPIAQYITIQRIVRETGELETLPLDQLFFSFNLLIPFAAAVFCSLFIGTEYSDGTIRNKLVIGHTRWGIYLANLITCTAVSFVQAAVYMITVGLVGGILLDGFQMTAGTILLYLLASGCVIFAFNALFVCLAMLNQNKAAVAIISLLGILVLLIIAMVAEGRLNEPEFWDAMVYMDDAGQIVEDPAMRNPNYIASPQVRAFLEFTYDFLPGGQSYQLANAAALHPGPMALYSLLIAVVSTLVGVFFFRRKDIK